MSLQRQMYLQKLQDGIRFQEIKEVKDALFLLGDVNKIMLPCGRTPLSLAVCCLPKDLVSDHCVPRGTILDFILKIGADVNKPDTDGKIPLFVAIEKGFEMLFWCLLDNGSNINHTDKEGRTPLIWALQCRYFDIVPLLIYYGADVNKVDSKGCSPLIWALKNRLDCQMLVEKGANVNKPDPNGRTPLSWAVYTNSIKNANTLLEAGANFSIPQTFLNAIERQNLTFVRYFVHRGAEVNSQQTGLYTPLIKAVEVGNFLIVKYLVEQGADVNEKDQQNRSPLSIAASQGSVQIFDYLIKAGANSGVLSSKEIEAFGNMNINCLLYVKQLRKNLGNSNSVVENHLKGAHDEASSE